LKRPVLANTYKAKKIMSTYAGDVAMINLRKFLKYS